MHPTPLFYGLCEHLTQRCPEAERAITHGQIGGMVDTASLEIKKQLSSALRSFAIAICQAQHFLLAPFIRPYEHQNALFIVHSWLDIHTIRPDIDDVPGAEVAFLPAFIILPPICLEQRDGWLSSPALG